jgi:putative flippase GtrA
MEIISRIVPLLPAPLQKLIKSKAFGYLIAAGTATVVDVLVYFIILNKVLHKNDLVINSIVFGAPGVSLASSYACGLFTNFTITKLFVFTDSDLRTRYQFIRFVIVAIAVLFANYGFMKFLIDALGIYPTVSRAISALSIGVLSFMIHRVFSFQIRDDE